MNVPITCLSNQEHSLEACNKCPFIYDSIHCKALKTPQEESLVTEEHMMKLHQQMLNATEKVHLVEKYYQNAKSKLSTLNKLKSTYGALIKHHFFSTGIYTKDFQRDHVIFKNIRSMITYNKRKLTIIGKDLRKALSARHDAYQHYWALNHKYEVLNGHFWNP